MPPRTRNVSRDWPQKQCTSGDDDLLPTRFDQTVLRFLVWWRRPQSDPFVSTKIGNRSPQEFGVKVGLDHTRSSSDIDEELLKLGYNGGTLEVGKTIHPLLAGGCIHKHETVFLSADVDSASVSDIHTHLMEQGGGTRHHGAPVSPRHR